MPLAVYKGGLIVKDGKLCTSCCDTPVVGKCCKYPYSNSGPQPANTAEEAIQLASESASANSAAIPNSIWTVGTPFGVPWVEGEAWYDSARNQYECTGYWTLGEKGECRSSTEAGCLSGPFGYFTPNATCEGPDDGLYDCPEYPPQPPPTPGACCYFYSASSDESQTQEWRCDDGITEQECLMRGLNQTFYPGKTCAEIECPPVDPPTSGICLYREDGKGTCSEYVLNGGGDGNFYATEAEAQAAGDAYCEWDEAPECYDCRADVYQDADDLWAFSVSFREVERNDATGENECIRVEYETTELGCGGDPLHDAQWENNLPATHCKPVSSEEECTESTGVFCPNVTECPDDSSTGCPETPNRSNPLP